MATVNAVTVKAIRTNLISIITGTIRWDFEDGSVNTDAEENYWAKLDLKSVTPEVNHGEGPMYIAARFQLEVNRKVDGKDDHQEKAIEVQFEIEENITVDALNVGDLLTSQLVSRREIDIDTPSPDSEALTVMADITIFFRDLRT